MSALLADVELVYENEKMLLKSVDLKTLVLEKKYSIIKVGNMNNVNNKSTRKYVWEFCLNNKLMLEDLIFIKFDKRMHEHLAIEYFYSMLDENGIRFHFSNSIAAIFTLSECAMSAHPGSRKITLYDWMMKNK